MAPSPQAFLLSWEWVGQGGLHHSCWGGAEAACWVLRLPPPPPQPVWAPPPARAPRAPPTSSPSSSPCAGAAAAMAGMQTASGDYIDSSWELRVFVGEEDPEAEAVTLRVTGESHIGGVLLKIVEQISECPPPPSPESQGLRHPPNLSAPRHFLNFPCFPLAPPQRGLPRPSSLVHPSLPGHQGEACGSGGPRRRKRSAGWPSLGARALPPQEVTQRPVVSVRGRDPGPGPGTGRLASPSRQGGGKQIARAGRPGSWVLGGLSGSLGVGPGRPGHKAEAEGAPRAAV